MRRTTTALIAGVLITAGSVFGTPLVKSHISSNADWVVHADYDRFRATQIGRLIAEELKSQGIDEKLNSFATVFSFHPLNDIRGVTLYGSGPDKEKAVVLIDGTFDKDKLVALVSMNPEHEAVEYGDITIHGWVDENRRNADGKAEKMYGCFYKDNLLVMSAGLDAATHAVDVLEGAAASTTDDSLNPAGIGMNGAFFQVAAHGVDKIAAQEPRAAMLKQAQELALVIGEAEGDLYIDVGLKATSEEAAESIRKMVDGIIAFANLAAQEQPKMAELVNRLQLSRADKSVKVRFQSSSQEVFSFLKEQWQKDMQKKAEEQ